MSIIQIIFAVILLASGILVFMTFIPNKLSDKISREIKDYTSLDHISADSVRPKDDSKDYKLPRLHKSIEKIFKMK